MKNLFKNILIYLIYKLFTEKEILSVAQAVTKEKDFVREIQTIDVKKGNRRYTLLVIQAYDGRYTINLGRHKYNQEITINGTL